jgi:hypothetical protein
VGSVSPPKTTHTKTIQVKWLPDLIEPRLAQQEQEQEQAQEQEQEQEQPDFPPVQQMASCWRCRLIFPIGAPASSGTLQRWWWRRRS